MKSLKDPDAPMWEKHGVLYALARAEPKTLAANLPLIKRYMKDEEWFLRLAAWQCIKSLVPDLELIRPLVPMLVEEAFEERHLLASRGMRGLVQEVIAHDSLRLEYIAAVNAAVKGWDTPPYPRNLDKYPVDAKVDMAIAKGSVIEVLRYMLKLNECPENALLVSDMFLQATRAGHGGYMINGGWGYPSLPPLVKKLGKDAGPLVSVMKTIVSVMKLSFPV